MKNLAQFSIPLFSILALLIISSSCTKNSEVVQIKTAVYTQNDLKKSISQCIGSATAVGFGHIFQLHDMDSLERALLIQNYSRNSRFLADRSAYIYTESLSGYSICNPANPDLEGTFTLGQEDANGKLIVQEMVEMASYTGYGFMEYDYLNPVSNKIEAKTTFIQRIPNSNWYIGSGHYQGGEFPYLTSLELNESLVQNSVTFMAEALSFMISSFDGDSLAKVSLMQDFLRFSRFFDDQSGYFYVIDFRGYNVVQPPNPDFQGTYELNIQDSRGNYLVRGLIETAQGGGGFYEYYWINYQTDKEELKKAYVAQIPGFDYLIGSGVYLK